MAKPQAKQPEPAQAEAPVQQPDKRRELTPEWRKHIAETLQQIAEGESRVALLEVQVYRIRRDQEFMREHVLQAVNTLGHGMKNPRLSQGGTAIEGD